MKARVRNMCIIWPSRQVCERRQATTAWLSQCTMMWWPDHNGPQTTHARTTASNSLAMIGSGAERVSH